MWKSCKERVDISDCSEQEIGLDLEEKNEWMGSDQNNRPRIRRPSLSKGREYGRFGFRRISRDRAQGNKQERESMCAQRQ